MDEIPSTLHGISLRVTAFDQTWCYSLILESSSEKIIPEMERFNKAG